MILLLPSAGKATRFGGIHKELLPLSSYASIADYSIFRGIILGTEEVLVVTSIDKIKEHAKQFTGKHVIPISYIVQQREELWGAMQESFTRREDTVMILPDTIWSFRSTDIKKIRMALSMHDLVFGVFKTLEPERFSVIKDGRIITKKQLNEESTAWGFIYWSKAVIDFWNNNIYKHYDEALQQAMDNFSWSTVDIYDYEDFGSFLAYGRYLTKFCQ